MAVSNTLQKKNVNEKIVEFDCGGETVKLSPAIIKQYLVNGNGTVTDQEVVMFLNLCRFQHLNPFLKEAYLIKYGSQPATIVVGKEVLTKRAMRNPRYAGQRAGVVVQDLETGEVAERIGCIVLDSERLVGGWAKVFVNGYEHPIEMAVSFDEYALKDKDGNARSNWAAKPATMIRKVALVQALREAFPEDLQNLYDADEMGVSTPPDTFAPIDVTEPPIQVDPSTGEVIEDKPDATASVQDSFFED